MNLVGSKADLYLIEIADFWKVPLEQEIIGGYHPGRWNHKI